MADTRVQLEIEDWVRENWMLQKFGQSFYRNRLKLSTGGVFDFDAVSEDKTIAACISTSAAKTSGGKAGSGKLFKLRSDMLFLLLAEGLRKKLIILTDGTMHAACLKEASGKRIPQGIEFLLASIPDPLQLRLIEARTAASKEVTREKTDNLPDEIIFQKERAQPD
jgi:hypothetical protein